MIKFNEKILNNFIDKSEFSSAYKDMNSVFVYGNLSYAKIVGLKHYLDIVGRTAYDMPARTSECADLFREQDTTVLKVGKSLNLIGFHPDIEGNFKSYEFLKIPLFDNQKKAVGIFLHGKNVTSRYTFDLHRFLRKIPIKKDGILLYDSTSYIIGFDHTSTNISKREHEVLFYLLRNYKAKTISNILNITPRTIYKHTFSLRDKFSVGTSSELKEKAMELGFTNTIPESIFDIKIINFINKKY